MEKTTKKRKSKKGFKKRIGLIAIGGLSLVLTVCLSVGATLAWFAGSTHADKSLFMGGPVYVEMKGRDGDGTSWKGGSGNLDITSFERGMGTVGDESGVLLPGQRFNIYSQARVYSTSTSGAVSQKPNANTSSGADTTNTSNTNDSGQHLTSSGYTSSTTSSVLRARFSVEVEFDPSVGFNNFTGTNYASNYPTQSGVYKGEVGQADGSVALASESGLSWTAALVANENLKLKADDDGKYTEGARRDAVLNTEAGTRENPNYTAEGSESATIAIQFTSDTSTKTELEAIKAGTKKSIYSWKFVSKAVYEDDDLTAPSSGEGAADLTKATPGGEGYTGSCKYIQMGAPFDGKTKVEGSDSVYYGVWILTEATEGKKYLQESDSFYKARCNNYIQTYVEQYPTEYGDFTERTVGDSLKALENALNNSFINLVNDSSNAMIAGYLKGMTVNSNGIMSYTKNGETHADPFIQVANWNGTTSAWTGDCSWLYIDPTIGNDTNTNELSTSTGGWWYLVECDNGQVGEYSIAGVKGADANKVNKVIDSKSEATTDGTGNTIQTNTPVYSAGAIQRGTTKATNAERLNAKLFEIKPDQVGDAISGSRAGASKVTSYQFPFVNGSAVLAGDELTNIFANAKITVKISFQAIQAFFPYTTSIDGLTYKNTLLGTAKALNIANAIPIYNEAFDYYENTNANSIANL